MPIFSEILTKLRENDSTLIHLDLAFQCDSHENEQDQLTDADMVELVRALTHNTYLTSLNLNGNKIGAEGIAMLAGIRLDALFLRNTGLNSECIDALILHNMLTVLDVSGNKLGDVDIAKLSQLPRLVSLDISENMVDNLSMKAFASHTALRKLSVKHNRCENSYFGIGPFWCLMALECNKTLESLDLTGNCISTISLAILARQSKIQALNLEQCYFFTDPFEKRADIQDVIDPITQFSKLRWLSIRGIDSKKQDMDQAAILLAPVPLEYLDISKVDMSAVGAKALACSTTLTTLIAADNYIGHSGLLALKQNRFITHLDTARNQTDTYPANKPDILQKNKEKSNSNASLNVLSMFNRETTPVGPALKRQRTDGEMEYAEQNVDTERMDI